MNVREVTLRGSVVVLEPLRDEHAEELFASILPGDDVWQWTTSAPRSIDEMREWIAARKLGRDRSLKALPFAQRDARTGRLFGSTSLFDLDERHRTGEIGYTWLAASHRRTGANTEAKYLLLRFAFEDLGLRRVQFVTDGLNERSQRAIERLGGVREGVLRKHMATQSGRVRDTVVFSILDDEWPAVKARLEGFMARHAPSA